jgi:hypothetical protein
LAGLEKPDQGAVGVEGRPAIIYVEQEQQVPEGKVAWTVADALTEPMVAGLSADTPAAQRVAGALKVGGEGEGEGEGGDLLPVSLHVCLRVRASCVGRAKPALSVFFVSCERARVWVCFKALRTFWRAAAADDQGRLADAMVDMETAGG